MEFIYTRANLISRINAGIQGKIGVLISDDDTANEAVRDVISDFDLRSTRRKANITPNLFDGIYRFAAPSDLKGYTVISIPAQADIQGRTQSQEFFLITTEEFNRKKDSLNGFIAVDDFNGVRQLLIALQIDDKERVVSTLDSLTAGGGTWEAFGDATNLRKDNDNFIKESASMRWDISAAGGTTAGIKNTSLNSFDLDNEYLGGNGAKFAWGYLSDKTNISECNLQIGSGESDYHLKTITTQHDGTAFVDGWNLLRFDLTSLTDTGTPDDDAITYEAIYWTKTAGKVSETDYRFDWLVLKKGAIHNVIYYSKFGWKTSAGVYIENSTNDSDLVIADTDEFNLYVLKGRQLAAEEAGDLVIAEKNEIKYERKLSKYKILNPSEARIMTNEYYNYNNII